MKTENHELFDKLLNIPIPESYSDCLELIKSDRYRITGKFDSSIRLLLRAIRPLSNDWLYWFRLSQYKGRFFPLFSLIYKIVSKRALVQIPPSTKIGYGLYVGHGICMVIHGDTIIGNNVNLSQFLNIGTNHSAPAIIGNNVYIGPHVSIVEDVKICSNATIGAGAVVCKSIPENATAAGVPAKVLNYDHPCRYIKNDYTA